MNEATWEGGAIGTRPEALCDECLNNGSNSRRAHPLEVLRSYLNRMEPRVRTRTILVLAKDIEEELVHLRSVAARELYAELKSWDRVGEAMGITKSRAHHVASGRDFYPHRQRARRARQQAADHSEEPADHEG